MEICALTSVYRKPTWSGLFLHFLSFAPLSYKKGLVHTLFDRSRKICSPELLDDELKFLFRTLEENGYPTTFIKMHSQPQNTSRTPEFGPSRKNVYLTLPFPGDSAAQRLRQKLYSSIREAFFAADPRLMFSSQPIGVRPLKDHIPVDRRSHVIYEFKCRCSSTYVGRTERRLASRVAEHLPRWLREKRNSRASAASAITRHAQQCSVFDPSADPLSYFTVLASSPSAFTLRILEAIFILRKKPPLCKQKEFVYTVQLHW